MRVSFIIIIIIITIITLKLLRSLKKSTRTAETSVDVAKIVTVKQTPGRTAVIRRARWTVIDRCMTGSVAEFVLTPIFRHHRRHVRAETARQSPGTWFACHVRPLAGYPLYDLQFSVVHRGDVINGVTLTSRRLVTADRRHPYHTADKYA